MYDPSVGRFISEDPHWNVYNRIYGDDNSDIPSLSAIMQSSNLYAYGMANPIKYTDANGENAAGIFVGSWSAAAGAAEVDGPFPYGDGAGLVIGLGGTVIAGGAWLYEKIVETYDTIKAKEITDAISEIRKDSKDVIIYRIGSGNATNLTPRGVDVDGLSYTTVMPTSGSFTITSIKTINATGVLTAVQDGTTHVSVKPVDSSKMQEWIASRSMALIKPHEYTQLLQGVSIKIR